MSKVCLEVGDRSDLGVESFLVLGARADNTNEIGGAIVVTRVQAADTMVLVFAHVRQVVSILFQPLIVEELQAEGTI